MAKWEIRHERFNPVPATNPRKGGGWYGHFRVGDARKRQRMNLAHEAAWRESIQRELDKVSQPVEVTL